MTLFYIFDKLVINIVDTHVSIVIIPSLFFYGFIPLKLVTKKKMVIITTIRKLIYKNGCYYIRVISQIVLIFNVLIFNTFFKKAFDYLHTFFILLLGTFLFPGKNYSVKYITALLIYWLNMSLTSLK